MKETILIEKESIPTLDIEKVQEDLKIHFDRESQKIIISGWNCTYLNGFEDLLMFGWETLAELNYNDIETLMEIIKNFQ